MAAPERPAYVIRTVSSDDVRAAQKKIKELEDTERLVTTVLVILGVGGLIFTAVNVTMFAIEHHVHWLIAWLLDPLVSVSLLAVLYVDGRLAAHGYRPGGWPFVLRWFSGLATWLMNSWESLYPDGVFTWIPVRPDAAGLVLHSVIPFLVIILAEAGARYRHFITRAKAVHMATVSEWRDQEAAAVAVADWEREQEAERARAEESRRRAEAAAAATAAQIAEAEAVKIAAQADADAKRLAAETAAERERRAAQIADEERARERADADRQAAEIAAAAKAERERQALAVQAEIDRKAREHEAELERQRLITEAEVKRADEEHAAKLAAAEEARKAKAAAAAARAEAAAISEPQRSAKSTDGDAISAAESAEEAARVSREQRAKLREDAELHAAILIVQGDHMTREEFGKLYGRGESWARDRFREAQERMDADKEFADRVLDAASAEETFNAKVLAHSS